MRMRPLPPSACPLNLGGAAAEWGSGLGGAKSAPTDQLVRPQKRTAVRVRPSVCRRVMDGHPGFHYGGLRSVSSLTKSVGSPGDRH